jgi:hypothetical protein
LGGTAVASRRHPEAGHDMLYRAMIPAGRRIYSRSMRHTVGDAVDLVADFGRCVAALMTNGSAG